VGRGVVDFRRASSRRTPSHVALRRCRAGTIGSRAAFVSQDFGPAVVGLLRHHIVVPAWTLVLDEAEQELVVAHGLEHALPAIRSSLAGVCRRRNAVECRALVAAVAFASPSSSIATPASSLDGITTRSSTLACCCRSASAFAARGILCSPCRAPATLAKRFDALLRRDVIERDARLVVVLAMSMLASVAFVPSPSVSGIANLIRPVPPAEPVVVSPLRAGPRASRALRRCSLALDHRQRTSRARLRAAERRRPTSM
jgi:hypothetical protein